MEKIYVAKTLDAAKEQAVNEFTALGIAESDIDYEILEQPVKKLFGKKPTAAAIHAGLECARPLP